MSRYIGTLSNRFLLFKLSGVFLVITGRLLVMSTTHLLELHSQYGTHHQHVTSAAK